MNKVSKAEDHKDAYRHRAERAGRALDNARMIMKHERRLLSMREKGIDIK